MPSDPSFELANERDPSVLLGLLLRLSRSASPADHALVRGALGSEEVLGRLDDANAYDGPPRELRLAPILRALAESRAAHRVLEALARDAMFNAHRSRTDLLIGALAALRPPPPAVLAFWAAHAAPDDGYTPLTIAALVANGTPEALALFGRLLDDPRHDDGERIGWLRGPVLAHRNDLPLLLASEHLVATLSSYGLRLALVEVLFDHRVEAWYGPHTIVLPPPREAASAEARAVLVRIGRYALAQLGPPPDAERAIVSVLRGFGERV